MEADIRHVPTAKLRSNRGGLVLQSFVPDGRWRQHPGMHSNQTIASKHSEFRHGGIGRCIET